MCILFWIWNVVREHGEERQRWQTEGRMSRANTSRLTNLHFTLVIIRSQSQVRDAHKHCLSVINLSSFLCLAEQFTGFHSWEKQKGDIKESQQVWELKTARTFLCSSLLIPFSQNATTSPSYFRRPLPPGQRSEELISHSLYVSARKGVQLPCLD